MGTIDSDTDAIKTSLGNIDNSVDGNFLNVNMNLAGSDAQAAEGTITSTTQRVTIATDDDGVAHLATIAGAVSTQMQVDVVAALPAGSNTIGVVDLGSTDNAVLDTIDATLDNMLYGTGLVVTALDGGAGDQTLGATYESLYVGVGGNVKVTLATSASDFTFVNLASGQLLPIRFTHVKQSGTTATNMIAMKA